MSNQAPTNPNAPLQYFNVSTGRWESSPSSVQNAPSNPFQHAQHQAGNTQNLQPKRHEPLGPASPSPTPQTPAASGSPTPNETAWVRLGYPEYGGMYEVPTVPQGYEVGSVTKSATGELEVSFKPTAESVARAESFGSNYLAGKYDAKEAVWLGKMFPEYGEQLVSARASDARAEAIGSSFLAGGFNAKDMLWLSKNYLDYAEQLVGAKQSTVRAENIGKKMLLGGSVSASESVWLGRNFPEYASQVFAVRQSGTRAGDVGAKITSGGYVSAKDVLWLQSVFPEYAKQVGEVNLSTQRANLIGKSYLAGGAFSAKEAVWLGKNFPEYGQALFELRGERANVIASKSFSPASTAKTETVSADEYFNRIYSQSTKNKGEILSVPVELKEQYASWVISKGFWSEKGTGHYFPELAGKYAPLGAEALSALSGGWQIEKMTETPEGVSVAWKQPPKSITQQISEFTVPSLGLRNLFTTPSQQLIEQKSPLFGAFTGATSKVKPLAPLEMFTVPVESAVLGGVHLVAKALGRDNPYFAAQPPISPFGALVGSAITMKPSVGELGSIELYEVGFRGVGDILTLAPTAELAVNLAKRGGAKLAEKIEVWRYGAEGSEKWMESIRAGTIVNPETGMTTYTGFAAKQYGKLNPMTAALPFGTTKSLPHILSGVSEETAMGAMDFSWDIGTAPRASMFSVTKMANAPIKTSLPLYQMIGGELVNVSSLLSEVKMFSNKPEFGKASDPFGSHPLVQSSIQIRDEFRQLGFKDVISPKATSFLQGPKNLPTGYSGSAPQRLYMKASNVFSEVKNILVDTGSAYRMELVLNKPSTSFMETTFQGISAGVSVPSTQLVGTKAISESVLLPLLGSYRGTVAEKEYVQAQNELYGKNEAPSRITIDTKLSSVFAFPTSVGAFPVIPEVSMSRQGQRLETKQADVEEYVSLATKLFQSQAVDSAYKTPTIQVQQLARLKPMEGATYIPKIADFLGTREREGLGLIPFVTPYVEVASMPITAQTALLKQASIMTPTLDIPTPNQTVIVPPVFGRLSIGGGGGRSSGFGFKQFGGVFRKWPVRLPKDVFAMSIKQMRTGMTYGSKVHPAMRGVQKGSTIRQPRRRRSSRGRRR